MADVDLGARRRAREEAVGGPHTIMFDGLEMRIPVEMPYRALEDVYEARNEIAVVHAVGAVVQPEGVWDKFCEVASRDDVDAFVETALQLWGLPSLGGPSASPTSSTAGGNNSRPTSSGSTDSTSDTPAGDTPASASDGSPA